MSIKEYLTELENQRDALADNLNIMGIQASKRETLNSLIPKVLQISKGSGEKTILFEYGNEVADKFGDSIFTIYQDGIRDINSYIRDNRPFCSPSEDFALSYTQEDFSWDGWVYTASIKPVSVSADTSISMIFQSGVTEEGFMCLIHVDGKQESDTIQNYIYTSIKDKNFRQLTFDWVMTLRDTIVSVSCKEIPDGRYYMCCYGQIR